MVWRWISSPSPYTSAISSRYNTVRKRWNWSLVIVSRYTSISFHFYRRSFQIRSNNKKVGYRNCRKTLPWHWTICKRLLNVFRDPSVYPCWLWKRLEGSATLSVVHLQQIFPHNSSTTVGRIERCIVFIFCYLWWRYGFEIFRNIPVFRPARCSWRCAVEPYWNEHQF
jgi:hypothetical protein